jgi:hypothetical protein
MNNTRLPRAASTLMSQVSARKPRTTVEPHGDPDGLGVVRSIIFNKATGTWLTPILEAIADPRIQSVETQDGGRVVVTFVHTIYADRTAEFPLDSVDAILNG